MINNNPWREITQIEHVVGFRGGEAWYLTLSCGHHKPVRIPRFREHRFLQEAIGCKKRRIEAPKKCRCVLCGIPPDTENIGEVFSI